LLFHTRFKHLRIAFESFLNQAAINYCALT
jgi:hypothetical protein